jgi:hypothetical protein
MTEEFCNQTPEFDGTDNGIVLKKSKIESGLTRRIK